MDDLDFLENVQPWRICMKNTCCPKFKVFLALPSSLSSFHQCELHVSSIQNSRCPSPCVVFYLFHQSATRLQTLQLLRIRLPLLYSLKEIQISEPSSALGWALAFPSRSVPGDYKQESPAVSISRWNSHTITCCRHRSTESTSQPLNCTRHLDPGNDAKVLPRPQAVQTLSGVPSTHQFPPPGTGQWDAGPAWCRNCGEPKLM